MGIPGLKICTAASPEAAYGITKSMIRDNGPGILFCPVKMMKGVKGELELGRCLPLNKAAVLHAASEESVAKRTAVTVLTYLHGVKEAQVTWRRVCSCTALLVRFRSVLLFVGHVVCCSVVHCCMPVLRQST